MNNETSFDKSPEKKTPSQNSISDDKNDNLPSANNSPPSQKSKNNHRNIIIGIIILLILGIAGLFIAVSLSTDESATNTQLQDASLLNNPNSSPTTADQKVVQKKVLDKIVYVHPPTDGGKLEGFSRPADGGAKVNLNWGLTNTNFSIVDRDQEAYIAIDNSGSNNQLLYGSGETKPTSIFNTNDSIVGAVLDETNKSVLVSTVSDFLADPSISVENTKSKVFAISLTDNSSQMYLERSFNDNGAYFPLYWNSAIKKIYLRNSCYGCDGYNADVYKLSETGNLSLVYDANGYGSKASSYSFNQDGSKLLFLDGSNYSASEKTKYGIVESLGEPVGAPFKLTVLDITSGKTTVFTGVGSIKDVNSNGRYTFAITTWVNINGNERIAYAYKSKLFVQNLNGATFSNFFDTGQGDIRSIYYISDDEVVIGIGNNDGEIISYFNLTTNKATTVMETLFSTKILSFTKKTTDSN